MRRILLILLLLCLGFSQASAGPLELHQRLDLSETPGQNAGALTLDACSGTFDADLVRFLIERRIAATLVAARRWLAPNPERTPNLTAHAEVPDNAGHGPP